MRGNPLPHGNAAIHDLVFCYAMMSILTNSGLECALAVLLSNVCPQGNFIYYFKLLAC